MSTNHINTRSRVCRSSRKQIIMANTITSDVDRRSLVCKSKALLKLFITKKSGQFGEIFLASLLTLCFISSFLNNCIIRVTNGSSIEIQTDPFRVKNLDKIAKKLHPLHNIYPDADYDPVSFLRSINQSIFGSIDDSNLLATKPNIYSYI